MAMEQHEPEPRSTEEARAREEHKTWVERYLGEGWQEVELGIYRFVGHDQPAAAEPPPETIEDATRRARRRARSEEGLAAAAANSPPRPLARPPLSAFNAVFGASRGGTRRGRGSMRRVRAVGSGCLDTWERSSGARNLSLTDRSVGKPRFGRDGRLGILVRFAVRMSGEARKAIRAGASLACSRRSWWPRIVVQDRT